MATKTIKPEAWRVGVFAALAGALAAFTLSVFLRSACLCDDGRVILSTQFSEVEASVSWAWPDGRQEEIWRGTFTSEKEVAVRFPTREAEKIFVTVHSQDNKKTEISQGIYIKGFLYPTLKAEIKNDYMKYRMILYGAGIEIFK